MSYTQYGIKPQFVEKMKAKMKNPLLKEKVKKVVSTLTKQQLQNPTQVRALVRKLALIVNEPISEMQVEQMTAFVIAQRIDPSNMVDLLRLWAMLR